MADTQTTLRDTISTALEGVEEAAPVTETSVTAGDETVVVETTVEPGKTETRARDESGKFIAKEATGEAAKIVPATPVAAVAGKEAKLAVPATATRPARPSSWKKEMWEHWDKLDPVTAEYIHQREGEYAKGVSTYKAEWDRAKPLLDALTPFQATIEANNMRPEEFIGALGQAHQVLSGGNPQEKLREFMRLAQDYRIPLNELFVQGEDGKLYFNKQYTSQRQSQGITPEDVEKRIEAKLNDKAWAQAIQGFIAAKDKEGNPQYPHFDEVKQTMSGLLQSGLAQDLPSAYEAALALPQHKALLEARAKQQREHEGAEKARLKAQSVQRARASAVSPKTQVPTTLVQGSTTRKGLRDQISESLDEITPGRV